MQFELALLALLFLILSLLVGALVRHSLKGLPVPYTVVLLIIGLLLGLVQRAGVFTGTTPMLAQTLELVSQISPQVILYLFLPTLIFESAFSLEVHLFRRMAPQIALLAIPGLVMATLLTALLAREWFPWEWSWALCLLFGALISATDPVAVVALLKEVSSRKRLETLIEGESLLNDGTAIVLFGLFYAMAVSGAVSATPLNVVLEFVWVVAGGLMVGAITGVIVIAWIGKVFNDPIIEITLSVVAAYLVFFIAERLHLSGVVALVTLAFVFAGAGRTRISPEVAGFLHHFWEMMAHMANTVIFLLVGILIAARVPLDQPDLWWSLALLYPALLVIRGATIGALLPLLKRMGIGLTREKALVLLWGGLRGAVSLALALTIAVDGLLPREVADQILFLCAGTVVLTIVVNGSSMGRLLGLLGLNRLPEPKQATVDRVKGIVAEELNQMLPKMMAHPFLNRADWAQVKRNIKLQERTLDSGGRLPPSSAQGLACRRRLLETERQSYWSQFESGTLGRHSTQLLVQLVERALDGDAEIGPRGALQPLWATPLWLSWGRRFPIFQAPANSVFYNHLALGYDLARGFMEAQLELKSHIQELAPDNSLAQRLEGEVEQNLSMAERHISQIRGCHPELVQALETQAASRLLLNRERTVIRRQMGMAVLAQPEAQRLLEGVEGRMHNLQRSSIVARPDLGGQPHSLFAWAKECTEATQAALMERLVITTYGEGEVIIDVDSELTRIGMVVEGSVESSWPTSGGTTAEILLPGEMLALSALKKGRSKAQYRGKSLCQIGWLERDLVNTLMIRDPVLMGRLSEQLTLETRAFDE
ncbi:cation:proton antiporter [Ferrimonas futtsuensis]|uniref:cation:proton antiporter domain-containing protein n=1 Tax=Ferrimonas futtsuensis TaxID=364764 RepID=UPI0004258B51|nr:cation:proton antiporter [Ferrimonas futtsuensis]